MDLLNSLLRSILSGYVGLFGDAHPLVSLVPLSILTGLGMLWVFKKTSNQKGIEAAKKKMQAYLLELRLYGDDPSLLFSAQKNLIASNLRYLGLMFKPALFLTVPTVILLVHLDAIYGIAPLAAGQPAIVTVQTAGRLGANVAAPRLEAPDIIAVETPAVRAFADGQFSWRIRARGDGDGALVFVWDERQWRKSVRTGERLTYVSHRRTASPWDAWLYAGEDRLATQDVEWVQLAYPAAEIETGSLRLHWLIWFLALSIAAGYLLKGVFGVKV